eukprot:scaffold107762_cov45-Phaeocystis_antarctica.AAC.1
MGLSWGLGWALVRVACPPGRWSRVRVGLGLGPWFVSRAHLEGGEHDLEARHRDRPPQHRHDDQAGADAPSVEVEQVAEHQHTQDNPEDDRDAARRVAALLAVL